MRAFPLPRPMFIAAALGAALLVTGCTRNATEADKAAAAERAAAKQQASDEAAAARKGIRAAEGVLDELPPPSKSRYLQVHTPQAWRNPFIIVGRRSVTLRVANVSGDTLPNNVLPGQKLTPSPGNKSEITVRLIDMPEALASLSEDSWPYGRVVSVEEDPSTPRAERPQMRRNVEAVMAMLNDLDVVANEWPGGFR